MKNILLCGAHRTNNFGDTLLAYLYGKRVIDSNNNLFMPHACSELNKQLINCNWQNAGKKCSQVDALVYHGGGFFSEPANLNTKRMIKAHCRLFSWYITPFLRLIRNKVPYAIIGVGAGPISLKITRKAVTYIFNNAHTVVVRDNESAEYMKTYGVTRPILVLPDAALSIQKHNIIKDKSNNDIPVIGLHIATLNINPEIKYRILDSICELAKQYQFRITLFTDDADANSQRRTQKKIISYLTEKQISNFSAIQYSDMKDMLQTLNDLSWVITDKLHVGICSSGLGKRVVSIPNHHKTQRFYNQLGVSEWLLDHNTDKRKLTSLFSELLNEKQELNPNIFDNYIEQAYRNFEIFDDFLKSI
ncbi:MAG: polysaccharide pyruvyl transferase family protein [Sedimentisphaerales bacterium]|nr:polysaccharide pyruvyl transferase family protein [Sedimentisphaerales bacterium]MBN2843097.1 polysaccharide pyruvyl transferase family protein [Sedimentisphaerales bacterium]